MSVRKWMFAGALLLAAGLSSLGFAQKPGLKFNPDKKFMLKELRSGIIKKLDLADCRIQHEISIVWKRDNLFEDSFKELFEDLFQIC